MDCVSVSYRTVYPYLLYQSCILYPVVYRFKLFQIETSKFAYILNFRGSCWHLHIFLGVRGASSKTIKTGLNFKQKRLMQYSKTSSIAIVIYFIFPNFPVLHILCPRALHYAPYSFS